MSVRIVTDSASDITGLTRKNLTIAPMAVTFGEETYLDGVNLTHAQFYEKLIESDTLPTTSQITPAQFEDAFRSAAEAGETVVCITISSKLSGTYQSACIAAQDYEGQVFVVDSLNAAIGEQILVLRALDLAETGMEAAEIARQLEREKTQVRVIALLDTLEYLHKGGRLSRCEAVLGGLLSIKPVVAVKDGAVALVGKAIGSKNSGNLLRKLILEGNGVNYKRPYCVAYSGLSDEMLQKYISDNADLWQTATRTLPIATVGCAIGTHIGPGAIAVAFFEKVMKEV